MTKFGIAALLLMTTLGLLGAIGNLTAEQRAKQEQAQQAKKEPAPLSDERMKDLKRRVIEACDREPVGSPDRPGICILNDQQEELLRVKQAAETVWREMKARCVANKEVVANVLHLAVIKLENDATRATVSYAIWKQLNDEQRQRLGWAVRCHQTEPNVVQVVDVNGVLIGAM